MKPAVISNANTSVPTGPANLQTSGNSITIPINHEYRGQSVDEKQQQPQSNTQNQNCATGEPQITSYGSTGTGQRQQHQEIPAHFQNFDFEPDVGVDMFPRSRLGRMAHDPFGDFGDFGFPQFNSLGRRRINPHNDDDFFNRLPSEFRQYIPESFTHRRTGSGVGGNTGACTTTVHSPTQQQPHFYNTIPQSQTRRVCDAAIQTENPIGLSVIDNLNTTNLNPYCLRNTLDMGIKSQTESENQSPRSASAPPADQENQPHHQFATQTSPQIHAGCQGDQLPQIQKMYYTPHTHPKQKQTTPPPETPGASYVRTIPIFVEGRSEPIINNKEIPNQNGPPNVSPGSGDSCPFTPSKQQTHRPTPLNTQQQPTTQSGSFPPQTPHTIDTINKIQDIQRDVLDLMSRVEKFTGTRVGKEYVYLDEMLTRNLLKLDNIDTNGKDSIRLARKEAIKCIQASINVLEAKAEENVKAAQSLTVQNQEPPTEQTPSEMIEPSIPTTEAQKMPSSQKITKESIPTIPVDLMVIPADKMNEPIALPSLQNEKFNEVKIEDCLEDDASTSCISKK